MDEKELQNLYFDETELRLWYDNQSDEIQINLDAEYQSMVPDFLDFLRRKRFEMERS